MTEYAYDVWGNLRSVDLPESVDPGAADIEYTIDGQNRRVGKWRNGELVQELLYQDQLNPVAVRDRAGASSPWTTKRFVYASRPNVPDFMVVNETDTYRLLVDQVGSVRMVVNVDTGAVAQVIDYDEFGRILSDSSPGFQPFGFSGGLYDQDTDLVRFGARDYDPETGRWTSKDPILFEGDQLNLYAYVRSNPVNLFDVTGEHPVLLYAGGLFVIGFGSSFAITYQTDAGASGFDLITSGVIGGTITVAGGITGLAGGPLGSILGALGGVAASGLAAANDVWGAVLTNNNQQQADDSCE